MRGKCLHYKHVKNVYRIFFIPPPSTPPPWCTGVGSNMNLFPSQAPCRQISLHSQIMWDNTSILTKALFAGSSRGQPTLCWVFMLSHIPIISQWQRQKLANVHQGASLPRAAPVKLSSRWDRVRFAPRRHVSENERRMGRKREKKGSWSNTFFFGEGACSLFLAQQLMYIYLTRENAGPQRLKSSHGAPQQYISRCIQIQMGNLTQTRGRKKNPWKTEDAP